LTQRVSYVLASLRALHLDQHLRPVRTTRAKRALTPEAHTGNPGESAVAQRFTATFSDDGNTITGRWEIAEDGTNYSTDFDLIYRRAGA